MHPQIPARSHAARVLSLLARAAAVLFTCGLSLPAWAHHPMDGVVPTTVWQGLLSGLAHPVIGPDHLAFLLAAALLAAWSGIRGWRGAWLALAFVGAGAIGTLLRRPGVELPLVEAGVALTLLVVAVALLWQRRSAASSALVFALVFALVSGGLHGWAYGEAVLGAEAAPIGAYLFALAMMQACLLALTHRLGLWSLRAMPAGIPHARNITGALSMAVGLMALSGALVVA